MNERLRVELLDGLRVTVAEREITPFRRPKVAALFAYLAFYRDRLHSREELIELLWPETDPEAGRNNLRVTLHLLRRQLSGSGLPTGHPLLASGAAVQLCPDAFTTDVAECEAALQAAAHTHDPGERGEHLSAAVALYRGELLPGSFEAWVLTERQALAEAYQQALQQLVGLLEQAGDLEGAVAYARKAVNSDPLREEAHYDLMRLYAAAGHPTGALRQYQALERLLREELGEMPSAATRALAEELRESGRPIIVARPPATSEPLRAAPATDLTPTLAEPPPPVIPSSTPGSAGTGPRVAAPPEPSRLPAQFTRFFGREEEIARLVELLRHPETRLVTLTGPGGSGKTRLAIAVAGRLEQVFEGRVSWVELADLAEADLIPAAIAAALGLAPAADREPLEQVVEHLRGDTQGAPWLLVLDNIEHLVEDGALLVKTLLDRIPLLQILATSRRSLGLSGEQEFALLPLPTPRRSDTPEQLCDYASVQLFVDRARAKQAGFQLTEANAAAVAELCDRLEGLPLALELAAARAGILAPQQMLEQLAERFEFLVSRQRDVPRRHRSLRAALESSYQLLTPPLQRFFARLSVFRGGCTLKAAAAVAGGGRWASAVGSDPSDPFVSDFMENPIDIEVFREVALPDSVQTLWWLVRLSIGSLGQCELAGGLHLARQVLHQALLFRQRELVRQSSDMCEVNHGHRCRAPSIDLSHRAPAPASPAASAA